MLLFDAKVAQRKLSPLREGECGMEICENFTFVWSYVNFSIFYFSLIFFPYVIPSFEYAFYQFYMRSTILHRNIYLSTYIAKKFCSLPWLFGLLLGQDEIFNSNNITLCLSKAAANMLGINVLF
jgi:hypothetical protein